jgi:MFS family permease
MSTLASSRAPALPAWRMDQAQGLWLLASLIVTFLGASSAPSPLYALYRQAWGFSALTLTMVFAVYALTLLAGLLVFGTLSDFRGRRPVILGSLVLQMGAMLLFWNAQSVPWLVAARALQGLATGIAVTALSAGLIDFHRERGPFINSIAPMLGMAVGAVGAGALVQFAPAPTQLVFEILLIAFGLQTVAAFFLPETVRPRPVPWHVLKPSFSIPSQARATMAIVMPAAAVQWALGGFYMSLGPTLATAITGVAAPLVGGALIGALLTSATVTVLFVRKRDARTAIRAGAVSLAAGLAVTAAGIHLHASLPFFAGTVLAGVGFGASFNASLRSLAPLASPLERAALMSTFFGLSYLAFSLPNVIVGLLIGRFGLFATATGYAGLLLSLVLAAIVLSLRQRQ